MLSSIWRYTPAFFLEWVSYRKCKLISEEDDVYYIPYDDCKIEFQSLLGLYPWIFKMFPLSMMTLWLQRIKICSNGCGCIYVLDRKRGLFVRFVPHILIKLKR